MSETAKIKQVSFACPKCKHSLGSVNNGLYCNMCDRTYPVLRNIPDFLSGDSEAGNAPVFGGISGLTTLNRMARRMDRFAHFYESKFFVSALLKLSGIRSDSSHFMDGIASFHAKTLEGITGAVLDVACGPATYSRRTATPLRNIYGIDISMGMLRQGMTYAERDRVTGVYLARARVEELPFEDAVFAGVICSGSLHLFPDPVLALREIARTMKSGAPLSVQTFVAGKTLINRFLQGHSWVHTFELDGLRQDLIQAGFEEFRPEVDGIVLTFGARKA
ncbi:methyltransferase domain-containing protein [Mycobacterium sp.]|uniref:methyltransferase domain-containing protein n=1 Tax=Mycobacterium sp. TaxID=1785 RepID=UPI003C74A4DB